MNCWLAEHAVYERGPMPPCSGQLVRAHLIKQQVIERADADFDVWNPRVWVPACGGPQGNGGHHGMLDQSRSLRIPRQVLPAALLEAADELGLLWWIDREYGAPSD